MNVKEMGGYDMVLIGMYSCTQPLSPFPLLLHKPMASFLLDLHLNTSLLSTRMG